MFKINTIDGCENVLIEISHNTGITHDNGYTFSIDLTAEHAKRELIELIAQASIALRELNQ